MTGHCKLWTVVDIRQEQSDRLVQVNDDDRTRAQVHPNWCNYPFLMCHLWSPKDMIQTLCQGIHIEILTSDSRNSGLTKPVTLSDRTHLIKHNGTNGMTRMIKTKWTKRVHVQPVPPKRVSTADTHASTDMTHRL